MATFPATGSTNWDTPLKAYIDSVAAGAGTVLGPSNGTDDTTAIHAARDAAGAGGTLIFPPGTYKTTAGLVMNAASQQWILRPGATILASGSAHAVTVSANSCTIVGPGKIDAGVSSGFCSVFIGAGLSDIDVLGVETANGFSGVRVKGATGPTTTRVRVNGCTIHNTSDAGVLFNWQCTDSEVSNNQIYSTGNGISIDNGSTRCRVIDNHITSSGRIGIEVFGTGTGATVMGNHINGATLMGMSIDTSDGSRIAMNRIENVGAAAGGYGIELARSNKCVVEGNYIDTSFDHGIQLSVNASVQTSDNTIIGNVVVNSGGRGISASGPASSIGGQRVRIIGNQVIDPGSTAITDDTNIGTQDWVVTGNEISFSTTARSAITLNGTGMLVADNRIFYSGSIVTAAGNGITLSATASNSTVTGNLVTGNGKCNIGVSVTTGVSNVTVLNNNIIGTASNAILATSVSASNMFSGNFCTITGGGAFTLGSALGVGNYNTADGLTKDAGPHRFDGTVGFNGTNPIAKPTVTGSKGANAALTSLLTQLAAYGLITDSST